MSKWWWGYVQQRSLLVDPTGEIRAKVVMKGDMLFYMTNNLYPEYERAFIDIDSAKAAAEKVYRVNEQKG